MVDEFAVIDLFAGAGGLGEGFAEAGARAGGRMRVRLSVEMDPHAVQTLRLRKFLRCFDEFPQEYFNALNEGKALPDWSELYPREWKRAEEEVRCMTLGGDAALEELKETFRRLRRETGDRTILIGGPPCQAYSIVGRSRNRAKPGYVPEQDHRHYLYIEYIRILNELRPAAFVMENVKGLLSSRVDGNQIVNRVIADLERPGERYRLVPLAVPADDLLGRRAADFLVEAEMHGIPQTRHRLFIIGVREDLIRNRDLRGPLMPAPGMPPVTCGMALRGLPRLRSRLSYGDSHEAWAQQVRRAAQQIMDDPTVPHEVRQHMVALLSEGLGDIEKYKNGVLDPSAMAAGGELMSWIGDQRLERVRDHETRSHIAGDIARYLFTSSYAEVMDRSPRLGNLPEFLKPEHANRNEKVFLDRFRAHPSDRPAGTITSHVAKDGHYYIHPDPLQSRSFTVREAARIQTFPDNFVFEGPRTQQYRQIGNAVPPLLAFKIANRVLELLDGLSTDLANGKEGALREAQPEGLTVD